MIPNPRFLLPALFLVLCVGVSAGCQSVEHMKRQDGGAEMVRPEDWVRALGLESDELDRDETAADGILFELRHRVEPVRIRLRRLPTPIAKDAHKTWTLLWLDEIFDEVEVGEPSVSTLGKNNAAGENNAIQVESTVQGPTGAFIHRVRVANHGAQTYLLETWGPAPALEKTREERQQIVASIRLPSGAATKPSAADSATSNSFRLQESERWQLTLPDPGYPQFDVGWQTTLLAADHWRLRLPTRLINVAVVGEDLDYPVDAATYARVSLDRRAGLEEISLAPSPTPHQAHASATFDAKSRVPMHVEFRFLTRGERAVQIVASTPAALYENNREVIEALLDSVRIKME